MKWSYSAAASYRILLLEGSKVIWLPGGSTNSVFILPQNCIIHRFSMIWEPWSVYWWRWRSMSARPPSAGTDMPDIWTEHFNFLPHWEAEHCGNIWTWWWLFTKPINLSWENFFRKSFVRKIRRLDSDHEYSAPLKFWLTLKCLGKQAWTPGTSLQWWKFIKIY